MQVSATLPKAERLSGKKAIAALMGNGRWDYSSHLRCCSAKGNGLEFSRMMVSVPKRSFKRAVKRNLLKRRMREAFRIQKDLIGADYDIFFIYNSREIADFHVLCEEMSVLLKKIASR